MREWNAVPCENASLPEAMARRHMTRNDDRVCDRCRPSSPVPLLDAGRRGGSSLPTAASSPPAAFSSSARQARGGGIPCDDESNTTRLRSGSPSPH